VKNCVPCNDLVAMVSAPLGAGARQGTAEAVPFVILVPRRADPRFQDLLRRMNFPP
jgi:hypothetical protein